MAGPAITSLDSSQRLRIGRWAAFHRNRRLLEPIGNIPPVSAPSKGSFLAAKRGSHLGAI